MVLEKVKDVRDKISKRKTSRVGLFIDGPNILRNEFVINLNKLREEVESIGNIAIARVFLNQFASEKLIEAVASQGFEPIISLGGEQDNSENRSDVDVSMAVSAMEAIYTNIDILIIATRDADFLPLVHKAKEKNVKVIVMGIEPGFSTALKNAADDVINIKRFKE